MITGSFVNAGSFGAGGPKPNFALNFITETLDSRVTFSRTSHATRFNSSGALEWAPNNVIRNNTMVGAVAGSPGTLPSTAWNISGLGSLTQTVVGTGAENGINYIDIRFNGTTNNTQLNIRFDLASSVPAAVGQTWYWSVYTAVVGGSTANISQLAGIYGNAYNSSSAFITSFTWTGPSSVNTTSTLTRTSYSATISTANTAFIQPQITLLWNSGVAIDITIRVGMPQMQLGTAINSTIATSGSAYYGPRFDYDPATLQPRGLLLEETRTNSVRNNTMQGAVTGTPGTLPTNWGQAGTIGTLTRQVVAVGVQNGISYIDLRLSGTTSSTETGLRFDASTATVAAVGQTWTGSVYLGIISGSLTNITSVVIQNRASNSTPTAVQFSSSPALTVTNTLSRFSHSTTLSDATIAYIDTSVLVRFSSGFDIDITLRIGLPQLELLSTSTTSLKASSPIPTYGSAFQRTQDKATVVLSTDWYNFNEGTLFCESILQGGAGDFVLGVHDNTPSGTTDYMGLGYITTGGLMFGQSYIRKNGNSQATTSVVTKTSETIYKDALRYKTDGFSSTTNALLTPTIIPSDGVPQTSTVLQFMWAFNNADDTGGAGWIRQFANYPRYLSDSELKIITN